MNIRRISRVSEPPPRNYQWREGEESKKIRDEAVRVLSICRIGQHILFEDTEDRNQIQSFITKVQRKKPTRQFTLCRLDRKVFGVWRLR